MAYSVYDAAVTPCAQQLGALAGIIDKASAHWNRSRSIAISMRAY